MPPQRTRTCSWSAPSSAVSISSTRRSPGAWMTRASMVFFLFLNLTTVHWPAPSQNTAEPALPGRWCCPLQGGGRPHEVGKPGGVLKARRHAAIHVQDVAVDEVGCIARQEHGRAHQV